MNRSRLADLWDQDKEDEYKEQIALQLFRLSLWLLANAKDMPLSEDLVKWFHRRAFRKVSQFAGVVRNPQWCPYPSRFGPHFGASAEECEERFSAFCEEFERYIHALDELDATGIRERVLVTACEHHLRFIEIHPFIDGNGRTGRICANYFAARYDLHPVEVYRTQMSEYEQAIGAWIRYKKISPLVDYWRPFMHPEDTIGRL